MKTSAKDYVKNTEAMASKINVSRSFFQNVYFIINTLSCIQISKVLLDYILLIT